MDMPLATRQTNNRYVKTRFNLSISRNPPVSGEARAAPGRGADALPDSALSPSRGGRAPSLRPDWILPFSVNNAHIPRIDFLLNEIAFILAIDC